ncbi:hypothetical protein DPV80_09775 [Haemophilus sputorum]|uniref:Uncharacterized protein n=1 Tax=Haemophilus sputorum TaxID=1078480 RepID=A0ABX9HP01_9PAST|nr:hypothetical protein DPV80_09775 [Haemophilus sputorum]RDF09287.1 hypothetical protein DPV84_09765 [Haemophilus sputorum]
MIEKRQFLIKFATFRLQIKQAVKNLNFFAKKTCKDLDFLYNAPHTTTRCCESSEKAVRRLFLFFNNISDNLCGHLLIDLI